MRKLTNREVFELKRSKNNIVFTIKNKKDFDNLLYGEPFSPSMTKIRLMAECCIYYWIIKYPHKETQYYTGTFSELLSSLSYNCIIYLVMP